MLKINFSPLTQKKLRRFKSIKRGYYSFLMLLGLVVFLLLAELFVNSRALLVYHEGSFYFPTYGDIIPGKVFGEDYTYETNYRELKEKWAKEHSSNFIIMPIVPFNPYENDFEEGEYPPYPPDIHRGRFLGSDSTGRDVLARLVYGFRIAILFSGFLLIVTYAIGITIGCIMGYWGGAFDLFFQRLIEIWTNIPFLYVVIIIASIIEPNFWTLAIVMAFFSWMMMTWYMRTATYKEKEREYVMAVKALGASDLRIIFKHIVPNSISLIVTFIPFSITSFISFLTSLDYLGFGLRPPTPSVGELLKQGTDHLEAGWIVSSGVVSLIVLLILVTFVGEAIREAFDPKKHTTYE